MRVGILALLHESNTFITEPTTWRHFAENLLVEGPAVRERLAGTHHEVGGFFEGLEAAGIEAVPIFAARAVPYGTITGETYDRLLQQMFAAWEAAGPCDGYLLAPHGATVSEQYPDADGYWLGEVRKRVGGSVPLVATLDPHANLSAEMVAATNALVAYRTNPHLDQRARGREAATLMARTLRGEIRPVQAAVLPPVAINIERQLTSEPQCRPLYELADSQLQRPRVLSNSILLGFPYADVAEMGSAVLAVADGDAAVAAACARELADYLWSHRHDFEGRLIEVDAAVRQAAGLPGPVCLLDMGDNVGGGSPADGTHLAHALRRQGVRPAFVCLWDPVAVERAAAVGQGKSLELQIGGRTDPQLHGEPYADRFTVLGTFDGQFTEPQPRHGGFTHCDQGLTAVLQGESGITVMATSKRVPPFSLRQLTTFGVDPSAFQVLVAKGVNAPVAAYAPVCPHLIRVNTAGCTTADLGKLTFSRRRRPMFPFERETTFQPRVIRGHGSETTA